MTKKDKFLTPELFQWESEAGISKEMQQKLIRSRHAMLFIRKVREEYGMRLPFIFTGTGRLTNPRNTDNVEGPLLFDVIMAPHYPIIFSTTSD